jgi:hypothetical protein
MARKRLAVTRRVNDTVRGVSPRPLDGPRSARDHDMVPVENVPAPLGEVK